MTMAVAVAVLILSMNWLEVSIFLLDPSNTHSHIHPPTHRQTHFDISQMVNQFFLPMSSIVNKSSSILCYFVFFPSIFMEQIRTLDCANNNSSNRQPLQKQWTRVDEIVFDENGEWYWFGVWMCAFLGIRYGFQLKNNESIQFSLLHCSIAATFVQADGQTDKIDKKSNCSENWLTRHIPMTHANLRFSGIFNLFW